MIMHRIAVVCGAIAKVTEGDSDFRAASQTAETDGGVAKSGWILRSVPLFHAAFVFGDEQIIAAAVDDLRAQLALAKHGVAGDQPAF